MLSGLSSGAEQGDGGQTARWLAGGRGCKRPRRLAVLSRLWCQTAYCRGNCHQQRDGFFIPLQNLLRAFEAHAGGVLMGEFVPAVTVMATAGAGQVPKGKRRDEAEGAGHQPVN